MLVQSDSLRRAATAFGLDPELSQILHVSCGFRLEPELVVQCSGPFISEENVEGQQAISPSARPVLRGGQQRFSDSPTSLVWCHDDVPDMATGPGVVVLFLTQMYEPDRLVSIVLSDEHTGAGGIAHERIADNSHIELGHLARVAPLRRAKGEELRHQVKHKVAVFGPSSPNVHAFDLGGD